MSSKQRHLSPGEQEENRDEWRGGRRRRRQRRKRQGQQRDRSPRGGRPRPSFEEEADWSEDWEDELEDDELESDDR